MNLFHGGYLRRYAHSPLQSAPTLSGGDATAVGYLLGILLGLAEGGHVDHELLLATSQLARRAHGL